MSRLTEMIGGTHAVVALRSQLKHCRNLLEPVERDFAEFEPGDLNEVLSILDDAIFDIKQAKKLVTLYAEELNRR